MMIFSNPPSRRQSLIAILIFIAISIWYYNEMIYWSAEGIHCWAQADRLSLAYNYYETSMNFFKPSSYNIYHDPSGIVGVEFPLQSYLAAIAGKILGKKYITISFRIITLLSSLIGLYTLFVWTFRLTKKFLVSFFPPVFYFVLPVCAYYAAGFLPDTCSLSLIVVSMYFLFAFTDSGKFKYAIFFIGSGTLAALIKMSAGVYFVTFLFHGFLSIFFSKEERFARALKFGLLSTISIVIILAQYFYIQFLDQAYHSTVFLASAKPLPFNYEKIKIAFRVVYNQHSSEYFLPIQECVLNLSILAVALFIIKPLRLVWNYYFHFLLMWVAAVIGFIVMGKQFYIHSYYVIVIGYPAFIFSTLFLTAVIGRIKVAGIILSATAISLSAILLYIGHQKFSELLTYHQDDFWGEGIDSSLNNANIKQNDKILIADGDAPNLSLLFADRKGIPVIISEHCSQPDYFLSFMRDKNLNYFVLNPNQYDSILSHAPCFFNYMKEVWKSEDCFIFEYAGTIEDQIWQKKSDAENKKITYETSFEDSYHCEPASIKARTGNYSAELSSANRFMNAVVINENEMRQILPFTLNVTAWIQPDSLAHPVYFVYSVVRNDSVVEYHQYDVSTDQLKNSGTWQMIKLHDSFNSFPKGCKASFYLWNPGGGIYFVDDFSIELRKNN